MGDEWVSQHSKCVKKMEGKQEIERARISKRHINEGVVYGQFCRHNVLQFFSLTQLLMT